MAGRKGLYHLKLVKDLRPKKELRIFVSSHLPPGCECSLFSTVGGIKYVIIVTAKKVSEHDLTLDRNSIIMKANMIVEEQVRIALEKCPPQEEE
ncbi:hypothetical protein PoB_004398800 [Plakobranchus ocellatus]|uniref:Uncharacterized protein n=1 Tax=Plakobranchus ocellatus TaxID=259542 RepID=A0AAV4BD53_9GAST|nr:hypothetical protein PoB_004398800 [Plakobranchus ocellatus]